MSHTAVYARFVVKPGLVGSLRNAFEEAAAAAAKEPGTLLYLVHESETEPRVLWMYELYASAEARAAHLGTDATARFGAKLPDLLAEPVTITIGSVLSSPGLRGDDE